MLNEIRMWSYNFINFQLIIVSLSRMWSLKLPIDDVSLSRMRSFKLPFDDISLLDCEVLTYNFAYQDVRLQLIIMWNYNL